MKKIVSLFQCYSFYFLLLIQVNISALNSNTFFAPDVHLRKITFAGCLSFFKSILEENNALVLSNKTQTIRNDFKLNALSNLVNTYHKKLMETVTNLYRVKQFDVSLNVTLLCGINFQISVTKFIELNFPKIYCFGNLAHKLR